MKFSFVIPAYNASTTIRKCLDSIIEQTYNQWEVIIIDDGSIDNTFDIIKDYMKSNPNIHGYTQKNMGPGITRNRAIKKTTGDYICFVDVDDYIETRYLEDIKEKIDKDKNDVIVLDNYFEKQDGTIIREEILSKYQKLSKKQLIGVQMTGKMPWGGCRKIIKKSIITDNDIEYSEDEIGEEALFSFRVFLYATNIGFLGKKVYHYVNIINSQSKKEDDDPWDGAVNRINQYIKEVKLEKEYDKEISSFAYTALVVSLYRISNNYSYLEARKKCKEKIKYVKNEYKYELKKELLEKRVILMLALVKLNLIDIIIFISKINQIKMYKIRRENGKNS